MPRRLAAQVDRQDYVIKGFTNEFGAALAACDLGLARAGGSVWELAAAGKPALLVPYPHATGRHQDTGQQGSKCNAHDVHSSEMTRWD